MKVKLQAFSSYQPADKPNSAHCQPLRHVSKQQIKNRRTFGGSHHMQNQLLLESSLLRVADLAERNTKCKIVKLFVSAT